jgi:hypothetical protein
MADSLMSRRLVPILSRAAEERHRKSIRDAMDSIAPWAAQGERASDFNVAANLEQAAMSVVRLIGVLAVRDPSLKAYIDEQLAVSLPDVARAKKVLEEVKDPSP